jgi:hypothetical protein
MGLEPSRDTHEKIISKHKLELGNEQQSGYSGSHLK